MAGARSKYDETFPDTVRSLARKGHTEKEMAQILGINPDTLNEYKKKYPEFSVALKEGKAPADAKVEAALFKRANGYQIQEHKVIQMPSGEKRIEVTTKEVLPDVTAQIFWLKNRLPKEWRDVQGREVTGADGGPVQITTLPDEKLAELLLKGKK